jgi:hypothetical protein
MVQSYLDHFNPKNFGPYLQLWINECKEVPSNRNAHRVLLQISSF